MFKNALVSVSDKTGLVEFLQPLIQEGLQVYSTGGTAQFLRDHQVSVKDVAELTQFPEVLGGRVKTLHPAVHMGLLANLSKPQDQKDLADRNLQLFDLVVVNLYPFEETTKKTNEINQLVEKIDVGGPTMLRAAAKNFQFVTVVCDPNDYSEVQTKRKNLSLKDRQNLACKVFAHTAFYDSLIAQSLQGGDSTQGAFHELHFSKEILTLPGRKIQELRYGENPHQKAAWFSFPGFSEGLSAAEILQGKELSYNNLLDLEAAVGLAQQFSEPVAVAVKHNNPCGVGTDSNPVVALEKALRADPISVFGGILALNGKVDRRQAELMSEVFLECVVATDFSSEALEILSAKKNLRLLKNSSLFQSAKKWEMKSLLGGLLFQETDLQISDASNWKIHGDSPSDSIRKDIRFGEKVCAALKSNAIAIIGDGQTLGLGMGQVNRVEAVEHALQRLKNHHPSRDQAVLVSDAFFPFPDSVELAARHGLRWIVQPGGSVKDKEVIAKAQELGVNLVITGIRHFRH